MVRLNKTRDLTLPLSEKDAPWGPAERILVRFMAYPSKNSIYRPKQTKALPQITFFPPVFSTAQHSTARQLEINFFFSTWSYGIFLIFAQRCPTSICTTLLCPYRVGIHNRERQVYCLVGSFSSFILFKIFTSIPLYFFSCAHISCDALTCLAPELGIARWLWPQKRSCILLTKDGRRRERERESERARERERERERDWEDPSTEVTVKHKACCIQTDRKSTDRGTQSQRQRRTKLGTTKQILLSKRFTSRETFFCVTLETSLPVPTL